MISWRRSAWDKSWAGRCCVGGAAHEGAGAALDGGGVGGEHVEEVEERGAGEPLPGDVGLGGRRGVGGRRLLRRGEERPAEGGDGARERLGGGGGERRGEVAAGAQDGEGVAGERGASHGGAGVAKIGQGVQRNLQDGELNALRAEGGDGVEEPDDGELGAIGSGGVL